MESTVLDVDTHHHYNLLKDYIQNGNINIYTVTSIFLKEYGDTKGRWVLQLLKAIMCLAIQILIPIFVVYDSSRHVSEACPNTGTWVDRATSCVLCLYILVYFIFNISEFTPSSCNLEDPHHPHIIKILYSRKINSYISESIFVFGVFAKIVCLCLCCFSALVVTLNITSSVDIVICGTAMLYINDISEYLVDDFLKVKCLEYLHERHIHIRELQQLANGQEEFTVRKCADCTLSISGYLFIGILPIVGILTFFLILLGIVYLPMCHP